MRRTPAARSDVFCRARGRRNPETRALQTRFSFARGGARADEKCAATRKRIRAAKDFFASRLAASRGNRPSTFSTALILTLLPRVTRASSVRGRFRSENRIGERSGANQPRSIDRRKDQSRIPNSNGGCPRQENVSRSICSVRKSYPRGYFFRARPKRERIGRRPAGVQNTRALTDARLRRRTSRARTCPARLRPRSDPSARRRNQTPADRRPSQRPRRRSFFTGTHS